MSILDGIKLWVGKAIADFLVAIVVLGIIVVVAIVWELFFARRRP